MSIVKRGTKYHFDSVIAGVRHRCSLGTSDAKAASRLSNRVAFALADGPRSPVWSELRTALPVSSFKRLTEGVLPDTPKALTDVEEAFLNHLTRREKLGEISKGTCAGYCKNVKVFFDRMFNLEFTRIDELTPGVVEDYCLWRREAIQAKGGSGRGLSCEAVVLSMLFAFAIEEGWIQKSPLRYKPRIEAEPEEVRPFTDEEMEAFEAIDKSPVEDLALTVLAGTGLRCSDVCDLKWTNIDWQTKTLRVLTAKRGKRVEIPLSQELVRKLDDAHVPEDTGLIFQGTATTKMYRIIRNLGERAGVANCFPHRFRHTFACRLLGRGCSLFDVARLLGDTHQVVDRHYAKWTSGQADRIRGIMGSE